MGINEASTNNDMFVSTASKFVFRRNLQNLTKQAIALSTTPKYRQNLPSYPLPELQQTLDKYLKSVQPFLTSSELENTKKLLQDFASENGEGTKLQKLLKSKAEKSENWLADWWVNVAYMEFRQPVVVWSSPGQALPFEKFQHEKDRLTYAAKLVLAALDYKLYIYSGNMPDERAGKDPLDMGQYKKIFGTCRIPAPKRDSIQFNPDSKHIVVVRNNNYFKLPVLNKDNQLPSLKEMISLLEEIMKVSNDLGPAVGILTSDHRDNWAKIYSDLIKDSQNKKSVEEIQKSLFLLCLDNPMPHMDENPRNTLSHQLIHGGGIAGNAANRWYDKTVQFVVSPDGNVGLTYEHSPSEGQPIAIMVDYLVNHIKQDKAKALPDTKFSEPIQLPFKLNSAIEHAISIAAQNIDALAKDLHMEAFQYKNYGKEFAKSQKFSPDSYIQMAMQYAFYKLHNKPAAHYESAATRKYVGGRTETIRSCSVESVNFAKKMLDKSASDQDKAKALTSAINAHKKYSVESVNAYGCDRHLLGLKLIALEKGLAVPKLFNDSSWLKSTYFQLSTSQVATKCDGFMCYGPIVNDGYGCCYNPRPDDINFAVSSMRSESSTCSIKFRKALEDSLNEMQEVLVKTQKSKL